MSKTPNIKLTLTTATETGKSFLDFRRELADDSPDSNMMILDTEIGGLKERCNGYDTDIEGANERLDGIDTELDGVNTEIGGLKERCDGYDNDAFTWGQLKHGMADKA